MKRARHPLFYLWRDLMWKLGVWDRPLMNEGPAGTRPVFFQMPIQRPKDASLACWNRQIARARDRLTEFLSRSGIKPCEGEYLEPQLYDAIYHPCSGSVVGYVLWEGRV